MFHYAAWILVIAVSGAAIVAGWNYARIARRMRAFATTTGVVTTRAVLPAPGSNGDARWGRGGGYCPYVTYRYSVDGVEYTSDRWTYATEGVRRDAAQREVDTIGDRVDVHYDPAAPHVAYLQTSAPWLGYSLFEFGVAGVLVAMFGILG